MNSNSNKVWFGIWVAACFFSVVALAAEIADGGNWAPYLTISILCANCALLTWRIWHESVQVIVSIKPSKANRACPDCGATLNINWGHCPECDEWREL